ncbi:MAG: hypothetical protein WCP79_09985 [Bacillota bacterium]
MEIYSYIEFVADQMAELTGNEVKMLLFLLNEMNKRYWRPVTMPESTILKALNISRPTFFEIRERLHSKQLIFYQSNGRYAPTYALHFHNVRRKALDE